jgi:hypothetical protein
MRELEYMAAIRVRVDDRLTDKEVTADLEKLLASEQARKLLQEPSPTRYGGTYTDRGTWYLESAHLTDTLAVLEQQAGSWEREAKRRDTAARTAHFVGNTTLAVQRAEAAHWLRHCAAQVAAAITGKPGVRGEFARRVTEGGQDA